MDERFKVFTVFFPIFAVIAIGGVIFFYLNRNVNLKRKVLVPGFVISSLIFLGFIYSMKLPNNVFWIAVPAVILISYLNIRVTKFCDSCGRTIIGQNPFSPPNYCSKCGAPLNT